jgi:GNAT superfamily N-acetyltransferase
MTMDAQNEAAKDRESPGPADSHADSGSQAVAGSKTSSEAGANARTDVRVRSARPEDGETIARFVRELAAYEKLDHEVRASADDYREHLFGARPVAEALIAEQHGEPVGFALFFHTFSTFRGQPGIYIEDIYVRPAQRGRGVGKALLATVARLAVSRGCGRVEWSVLNWNSPAIGFYRTLGARPMDEWTVNRIDEEALTSLAASAPGGSRPLP